MFGMNNGLSSLAQGSFGGNNILNLFNINNGTQTSPFASGGFNPSFIGNGSMMGMGSFGSSDGGLNIGGLLKDVVGVALVSDLFNQIGGLLNNNNTASGSNGLFQCQEVSPPCSSGAAGSQCGSTGTGCGSAASTTPSVASTTSAMTSSCGSSCGSSS